MRSKRVSVVWLITLALLAGCGGGGGLSSDVSKGGGGSSEAILIGTLVDAPTAGVSYVCVSQRGKTDSNRRFNYQFGQTCTF